MASSQRIFYVNTFNRNTGTPENFSYTFQIPQTEKYDRVVVLNASIPSSFYLVQAGYNTFTLRENSTDVTITVPKGNYSAKVFASVLAPLLTAASTNGWTYSMTLPNQNIAPSTGKFTYSVTGNGTSQPSILCSTNVNEQLGFRPNTTNTFINGSLESTTTVNFGPESTLFIHSDISNNGDNDILQEIYSGNTEYLSYITYLCSTPEFYSKALVTNQSNTFRFTLTNEKGQTLDLNGVDMQITICLYKADTTNKMMSNYIKYKLHSEGNSTE